jgi:hypothetical protein
MKIIKQLNGNVHITDDSGNIERVMNNQPTILWVNDNNDLHIVQQNDRYENIDVADVSATQILPAAEIAFTGTGQDLLTLLSGSFFFELEGSGGAFEYYPSGVWKMFLNAYETPNTFTALIANQLYGTNVEIPVDTTVDAVRIRVVTAVAGSAVAGIYKYNEVLATWDLIVQTPSGSPFDLGVVAVQEKTLTTPTLLEAGIYCLAILASSAATVYHVPFTTASPYFGFNGGISTTNYYNAQRVLAVPYSATMPASPVFIPSSLLATPLTFYKIQ